MSVDAIAGKYELERELARGGMGSIWVAFDRLLHRRVAVKRLSSAQLASARGRRQFEREAQAVARLQHPNVVQIFDYGIDATGPFIVMELLEGETLSERLARVPTLSAAAFGALLAQATKGLAAAHDAGIVHRDLKPGNLFLARSGAEEILKIVDFGVASVIEGASRPDEPRGALIGTPGFMSPEQLRGSASTDHRGDLWSLAVVSYRALTGEMPFQAARLGELLVKISTDAPAPPSSRVPGLGAGMDRFFERALAKDAGQRFQSARELGAAFAEASDPAHARRAVKILYVDDEPDAQLLVRQQFRRPIRDGVYEFVFAENGALALDALRANPDIDVVLSDINMPVMDGLTLLGRVREVNARAKVILVSAYSDIANIRAAMNRGAFDFLVKPVDFRDAAATLEKTVASVREARRTHVSAEENRVLRMFVSPSVVERLLPSVRAEMSALPSPASLVARSSRPMLDARLEEVTVIGVDVYGFGARVAGDGVDALLRRLNANFEVIAPELAARGGVVERFGGDELMAVFSGPRHAVRALEAAIAVRTQLATMAIRADGDSPYEHGVAIGVASGPAVAGTVGSQALSRFDHALLGDVVGRAARLKGAARRNEILVDDKQREEVARAFTFRELGRRPRIADGGNDAAVWDVLAPLPHPDERAAQTPSDDALTATVTHAEDMEPARPPRAVGGA